MSGSLPATWSRFWFSPIPTANLKQVRLLLCMVVVCYFVSAWSDVEVWFSAGAPASSTNLSTFFRTAELTSDARWMISPLYIWDALFAGSSLGESATVYRLYLLIGIGLAIWVAVADRTAPRKLPKPLASLRYSSWPGVILWVWFVGWANRIVLLAGIVEPVLSVSLAALAIAPLTGTVTGKNGGDPNRLSWRTNLSRRLLSVQLTLIAMLSTATMLSSPTWWNGTGAYAMIAPVENRWFDVRGTFFQSPWCYESLSILMVALLPLGIILAWRRTTHATGIVMIWAWCFLAGLLTANPLYAATLAIVATTLGDSGSDDHAPAEARADF